MKIYTVMQAPYTVAKIEGATIFMGTYFDPEVFDDEDDAVESAQRLARQHRGTQVWIIEGEASRSFLCEPLPVVEGAPSLQVGA